MTAAGAGSGAASGGGAAGGGAAGGGAAGLPLHDHPGQRPSAWAPRQAPFGSTLDEFCGWVEWVDTAYELVLPGCWALHEGLVHTLTALWHVWRGSYAQPGGSGAATPAHGGPIAWHTHYLYPLRDRLQTSDGIPGAGCRRREHRAYTRRNSITETVATTLADAPDNGLVEAADVDRLDQLARLYGPPAAVAIRYE